MKSDYQTLADALIHRLAVIQDKSLRERDTTAHLLALQKASEAILDATSSLPANIPPDLRHYLEQCSYDKALAWIQSH